MTLPLPPIRNLRILGRFSVDTNPHESRKTRPPFEERVAATTKAGHRAGALGGVEDEDPMNIQSAYHRRKTAAALPTADEPDSIVTRRDLRRPAGDLEIARRDQPAGEEHASGIGSQTPPGGSKR